MHLDNILLLWSQSDTKSLLCLQSWLGWESSHAEDLYRATWLRIVRSRSALLLYNDFGCRNSEDQLSIGYC